MNATMSDKTAETVVSQVDGTRSNDMVDTNIGVDKAHDVTNAGLDSTMPSEELVMKDAREAPPATTSDVAQLTEDVVDKAGVAYNELAIKAVIESTQSRVSLSTTQVPETNHSTAVHTRDDNINTDTYPPTLAENVDLNHTTSNTRDDNMNTDTSPQTLAENVDLNHTTSNTRDDNMNTDTSPHTLAENVDLNHTASNTRDDNMNTDTSPHTLAENVDLNHTTTTRGDSSNTLDVRIGPSQHAEYAKSTGENNAFHRMQTKFEASYIPHTSSQETRQLPFSQNTSMLEAAELLSSVSRVSHANDASRSAIPAYTNEVTRTDMPAHVSGTSRSAMTPHVSDASRSAMTPCVSDASRSAMPSRPAMPPHVSGINRIGMPPHVSDLSRASPFPNERDTSRSAMSEHIRRDVSSAIDQSYVSGVGRSAVPPHASNAIGTMSQAHERASTAARLPKEMPYASLPHDSSVSMLSHEWRTSIPSHSTPVIDTTTQRSSHPMPSTGIQQNSASDDPRPTHMAATVTVATGRVIKKGKQRSVPRLLARYTATDDFRSRVQQMVNVLESQPDLLDRIVAGARNEVRKVVRAGPSNRRLSDEREEKMASKLYDSEWERRFDPSKFSESTKLLRESMEAALAGTPESVTMRPDLKRIWADMGDP
ncbi:hypothetical protein SARC_05164 [Sphaeroforma arctica JP610]|uniref:Uncharacterized protein n=1 Tax=Sphaeroforma arctica JP610 TaxID=667725 RepID=A0A0L0G159_9EUKA|nr:hypothetical protein SARC_05164 [Sphaeroforma arctica JP610]KNC82551.1 hypothetical protein SARC_05164 [Sphaeroforma arctica JP610]|eukprot:XP_014156453.1 hypothetical protein SARC_05164 [Sphaeroforma arctica JP610]